MADEALYHRTKNRRNNRLRCPCTVAARRGNVVTGLPLELPHPIDACTDDARRFITLKQSCRCGGHAEGGAHFKATLCAGDPAKVATCC